MKYLTLNDLDSYRKSLNLADYVWNIVLRWNWFLKQTMGVQFVRAIDSISANIAEGFGRYGKKDKVKFYRYSLGSIKESLDWNEKAKTRKIISVQGYRHVLEILCNLPREINQLINFTNKKLKQ